MGDLGSTPGLGRSPGEGKGYPLQYSGLENSVYSLQGVTKSQKAECQRIDVFELWWWRRFLRVLWTARRYNQSILKEISPGCSSEGLMLKLKLQFFVHLMRRADSLEKTLIWERLSAGGEGDDRG